MHSLRRTKASIIDTDNHEVCRKTFAVCKADTSNMAFSPYDAVRFSVDANFHTMGCMFLFIETRQRCARTGKNTAKGLDHCDDFSELRQQRCGFKSNESDTDDDDIGRDGHFIQKKIDVAAGAYHVYASQIMARAS